MRVISKKTILNYCKANKQAEQALLNWYKIFTDTNWQDLNHLKKTFPSVDFVGRNHYVFNIKGNTYRLIAIIQFLPQRALIRFIGTHAEYDKIKDISNL